MTIPNEAILDAKKERRAMMLRIEEIRREFDAGAGLIVNTFSNTSNSITTHEIMCGALIVGVIKKYNFDRSGIEFFLISGGIGIHGLKVKSFSDGMAKLMKKVGL